jgi:hypothetical protein
MTEQMFVRFGEAPAGGYSRNDETGELEAGVSCYRAEWQDTDHDVICVEIPSDTCVGTLNQCDSRPVYLIEGDLLDEVGGDGEPLMTNVKTTYVGPVEIVNYVVVAR